MSSDIGYFKRVRAIVAAQNFSEFYSRHFSRRFSAFVSAACVGTPIRPNHLTLLMIPVGLAGAALCVAGTNSGFLSGGLCFVLLNILDAADGELARYTRLTSKFGDYLDRVTHYTTNGAVVAGVGAGLAVQTGDGWILIVMILGSAAIIGDDAIRDLLVTCGIQGDSGDVGRKTLKAETSLVTQRTELQIASGLFSNIALFHILPVLALAQALLNVDYLVQGYYVLFCTVTVVKSGLRGAVVFRRYG